MARQLDQTIADAVVRNRSLAETLESLIDCELESRNRRSIERRFRLSRLHSQHSIDSFHFKHHKSRLDLKPRILRLLDLEFIAKGTRMAIEAGHFRKDLDAEQFSFDVAAIVLGYHHLHRMLRDTRAGERARAAFERLIADAKNRTTVRNLQGDPS